MSQSVSRPQAFAATGSIRKLQNTAQNRMTPPIIAAG